MRAFSKGCTKVQVALNGRKTFPRILAPFLCLQHDCNVAVRCTTGLQYVGLIVDTVSSAIDFHWRSRLIPVCLNYRHLSGCARTLATFPYDRSMSYIKKVYKEKARKILASSCAVSYRVSCSLSLAAVAFWSLNRHDRFRVSGAVVVLWKRR